MIDNRLISSIYGAAVSPNAWHSVLEILCRQLALSRATISSPRRRYSRYGICWDVETARYAPRDPTGDMSDDFGDIPADEVMVRSVAENDAQTDGEVPHVMAATLPMDGDPLRFRLYRTGKVPFVRADVDLFKALLFHIPKAIDIARHVSQLQHRLSFHDMALNRVTVGLVIIGSDDQIVWVNQSAKMMSLNGDAIDLTHNQLRCCLESDTSKLWKLIKSARADPDKTFAANLTRMHNENEMSVMAIANPEHDLAVDGGPPDVGIFLWDLAQRATLDPKVLKELFGFTYTEVRLAIRMAEGSSVEEAALQLGIKPATVRVHLRSIYSKVGVHRQSELIRRILV